MHKGYKIVNDSRIPICAPDNSEELPDCRELLKDHPCNGCPVLNVVGTTPFCFVPNCLRNVFEHYSHAVKSAF